MCQARIAPDLHADCLMVTVRGVLTNFLLTTILLTKVAFTYVNFTIGPLAIYHLPLLAP